MSKFYNTKVVRFCIKFSSLSKANKKRNRIVRQDDIQESFLVRIYLLFLNMSMTENKKSLEILHLALSFGLILIIGIMYYLKHRGDGISLSTEFSTFNLIGVSVAILGLLASQFIFKSQTKGLNSHRVNDENISSMRPAYLVKWAFLEGAGLINTLLFFISGNVLLLYFAIGLSLLLYLSKPRFY